MKCGLCGCVFKEKEAARSCRGCIAAKGCGLIKCPRCGYETPPEPEWLRRLAGRSKEG